MEEKLNIARQLLAGFKKKDYVFGVGCLEKIGSLAKSIGNTSLLVISEERWALKQKQDIKKYLEDSGIRILKDVNEPRPNTPMEDVYLLQDEITKYSPDMVIAVGGGSAIDCAKASAVLSSIAPAKHKIEPFFGVGKVTEALKANNKEVKPVFAVQTASSSAAHLTKYSNITNLETHQKKLIVDDAIIPKLALFDYAVTLTMPKDLTIDGAADGISHALEVYLGAGMPNIERVEKIALLSIELAVNNLPGLIKDLKNISYREAIGLSTDLGGYCIMIGGTNGAHLTSFSLVDILSHGRACAILNPYYLVFFAPAIERQLKKLALIFAEYMEGSIYGNLSPVALGKAVAVGIINFYKTIGLPTKLEQINGFTDMHIEKAIEAAKNPQLEMKLKNMPVPLSSSLVEEYMKPVLMAAKTGDLSLIKNISN